MPPKSYYLHLLNQPTKPSQLHQIQSNLTTSGLLSADPSLHAALLRSLSLSPSPSDALHLFAELPHPTTFAFAYALKACARSHNRTATKTIHALSVSFGHIATIHVANTALHAYASCGDVASARKLFHAIPFRNTVKYNAMISGYVQNGLPVEALDIFRQMRSEHVSVTVATVVTVFSACARSRNECLGMQLHGFISKRPIPVEREIGVSTALLDMYAKCGYLASAERVFVAMESKDIGTWNALIGGYVSNGHFDRAVQYFQDLLCSGRSPDKPTLVSTLCACAHSGALEIGMSIYRYIEEKYSRLDAMLGTSLIEMFSKCGCIEKSLQVFGKMAEKDVMAWSSMIGGLAAHGRGRDALDLYKLMKESGLNPDSVTFVGVLSACSHSGLVEEGLGHFKSMTRDYGVRPRVEHFGCVIDLLSRTGQLGEALDLIGLMESEANPVIWRTLLSACRFKLDVELAEVAVDNLMRLGSGHCGDYVLLSNIYASKGMWDDAKRVRMLMNVVNIRKKPAFTLIESE